MFPLPLDNLLQVDCDESRDEEEPVNSGPTFFRCASLAAFYLSDALAAVPSKVQSSGRCPSRCPDVHSWQAMQAVLAGRAAFIAACESARPTWPLHFWPARLRRAACGAPESVRLMAARATARRGELEVPEGATDGDGTVADTYLSVRGWTMGLAWVNGFNLGWYWPARGPANTMCARRPPSALALCAMRPSTGWAFLNAHGICMF